MSLRDLNAKINKVYAMVKVLNELIGLGMSKTKLNVLWFIILKFYLKN
ncbi:hypothetical protein [Candidatus Enterovibrio altilux]|uniref:Mobile element protein n=1 Tax=Candidatus Enterovibrio altilux TaxID=1927128 RepID=A0A291B6C8_9GAMM|nr:hypothetical protein BTN50_0008 [Candidatus Enterovibrio luxaltus]